ncbi:cytochrome P450 [Streptomyces sp. NPDC046866]|uniref:cytochrome P450 n=1 Tax=Streptomyces sp. NPDC046866 TaxID=3154921 RepID=UPI0034533775
MAGSGTTRAAVTRGPAVRTAGRAESVRFAATRAIPFFVRGVPGARPAFSAETLRALRDRHGGAPVLVRGLSGRALVLLDPQDFGQFYAEPAAPEPPPAPAPPSCEALGAVIAEEARLLAAASTLELVRVRHAVARLARRIAPGAPAAAALPAGPYAAGAPAGLFGRLCRRGAGRERAAAAEGHVRAGRAAPHAGPAARPQPWLRAVDTVPGTLLRTLLLLGAHPAEQTAAAAEAAASASPRDLVRMRACVLESLRLYPAVPELVRITRAETEWRGVRHPAGTCVLLPAHFHQRDPAHVPAAHVFVPGRWKTPGADEDLRLSPFGHGPGRCPGDRLGLLLTTALCAELLRRRRITGVRPVLDPPGPLPAVLDPRGIRLTLTRR